MCGHHEVVDVLCEDEPHNLLRMLSTSPLLLHVAARSGHDHIVWRLCASSANVNDPWWCHGNGHLKVGNNLDGKKAQEKKG